MHEADQERDERRDGGEDDAPRFDDDDRAGDQGERAHELHEPARQSRDVVKVVSRVHTLRHVRDQPASKVPVVHPGQRGQPRHAEARLDEASETEHGRRHAMLEEQRRDAEEAEQQQGAQPLIGGERERRGVDERPKHERFDDEAGRHQHERRGCPPERRARFAVERAPQTLERRRRTFSRRRGELDARASV
jgi:hypothetical protein